MTKGYENQQIIENDNHDWKTINRLLHDSRMIVSRLFDHAAGKIVALPKANILNRQSGTRLHGAAKRNGNLLVTTRYLHPGCYKT